MKQGFTLLEIIAAMILLSVVVLSTTLAIVPITEALFQTRQNVHSAQKTQLAVSRIVREFTTITNIVASSSTSITYDFIDPAGASLNRTLSWGGNSGNPLLLDNIPLSDDIAAFELRYLTPAGAEFASWNNNTVFITVRIQPLNSPTLFQTRVFPRNMQD
ncbi:MAG TPA: prepilin-type N-terminal cleavage/methylation domain-containing protein [Kiritimatiellia bacterium]|nr:prepilin-type N-terminal cleavage/methylation domain-containing protein [Kiritimatiellia bacterium]